MKYMIRRAWRCAEHEDKFEIYLQHNFGYIAQINKDEYGNRREQALLVARLIANAPTILNTLKRAEELYGEPSIYWKNVRQLISLIEYGEKKGH